MLPDHHNANDSDAPMNINIEEYSFFYLANLNFKHLKPPSSLYIIDLVLKQVITCTSLLDIDFEGRRLLLRLIKYIDIPLVKA